MTPHLTTFTGRIVNPLDLKPKDINIRDIAHALALCNRFAGHTRLPISVAQHSVFVSRLLPPEQALQGLLHDASEAYLGDVTKWLKESDEFAAYRIAEERVQSQIFEYFGCPTVISADVWNADKLMVRYEAMRSGLSIHHPNYPVPTAEEQERVGKWDFWQWEMSEDVFLYTYRVIENMGFVMNQAE